MKDVVKKLHFKEGDGRRKSKRKSKRKKKSKRRSKGKTRFPYAKGHLFFVNKGSNGKRITPQIVRKYPEVFSGKEYKHLINRYL